MASQATTPAVSGKRKRVRPSEEQRQRELEAKKLRRAEKKAFEDSDEGTWAKWAAEDATFRRNSANTSVSAHPLAAPSDAADGYDDEYDESANDVGHYHEDEDATETGTTNFETADSATPAVFADEGLQQHGVDEEEPLEEQEGKARRHQERQRTDDQAWAECRPAMLAHYIAQGAAPVVLSPCQRCHDGGVMGAVRCLDCLQDICPACDDVLHLSHPLHNRHALLGAGKMQQLLALQTVTVESVGSADGSTHHRVDIVDVATPRCLPYTGACADCDLVPSHWTPVCNTVPAQTSRLVYIDMRGLLLATCCYAVYMCLSCHVRGGMSISQAVFHLSLSISLSV